MSLFDRFGHDGKKNAEPFFVGSNCHDSIPHRSPAHFYFHQNFDAYQDRLFLLYLRDRLIWLYGIDEDDPMITKLLDIAHRTPTSANSSPQGI